jgi:hypothetical protein
MNKIKTIIYLITFVFVSVSFAGQYEYIKIKYGEDDAQVKQVFTYFPPPNSSHLIVGMVSSRIYGVYRLTVSPEGNVTQIRVIRHAKSIGNSVTPQVDTAMLHTFILWKAKPSKMARIIDLEVTYHTYFLQNS